MQTVDFQTPVSSPPQIQNENTTHYGILVGGLKEYQWNGIGEASIGHHILSRRVWLPFVPLAVGRRNEFDGALDMPENTVQMNWDKNPSRVRQKTARECALDFQHSFRDRGGCIPEVLIGHTDPQGLTERVWPREIRDKLRLFEHIQYFETFKTDDAEEAQLASALLEACYVCREHVRDYVRDLKQEISAEKGLTEPNEALKELFYEINEPLPEQRTALVASAMGKEIVKSVSGDGRKDDAVVNALNAIADSQKAITSRLEALETKRGPGRPPKSETRSE